MSTELPIACSLTAVDLADRLTQMADLGRDALLSAELAGDRAQLRFASAPDVRQRLDGIVAAESECCAFLTMTVREQRGELVLAIAAPEGAEVVLEELVGAFPDAQNKIA